jgi:dihydroorotate dehydrogenase (fumarate)
MTMDLRTSYMGFELPHPFMPGASPLADEIDTVRRLEDAGASAIVLRSLFEEQIKGEELATHYYYESPAESFAEAQTYLPDPHDFVLGPDEYLEQLRRVRAAVHVPVFGSLNGTTDGGWLEYAGLIQQAGAQGLELNVFQLATDPELSGEEIEQRTLDVVERVVDSLEIPVAVKLSPFYSSLTHFAKALDERGVKALVLFNRFYQADIDVEELTAAPTLRLSDSSELLLRLQWMAILFGHVRASLAVTGGVHTVLDAVKALMSGASAVQCVSALLKHGPETLGRLRQELGEWLEEHEYSSLGELVGSMSLLRTPDPQAYTRGNYMRILQSWKGFV